MSTNRTCVVEGCDARLRCKGYCNAHYKRYRKYGDPEHRVVTTDRGEPLAFVLAAVQQGGEACIEWPFNSYDGYGRISVDGLVTNAHRHALILSAGSPETGMEACHKCHNRKCINPEHLYWGTRTQNQSDRLTDGTDNRGEKSGRAKLTTDQVLAIREDDRGTREIANEHGVDPRSIRSIRNRESWAWL